MRCGEGRMRQRRRAVRCLLQVLLPLLAVFAKESSTSSRAIDSDNCGTGSGEGASDAAFY